MNDSFASCDRVSPSASSGPQGLCIADLSVWICKQPHIDTAETTPMQVVTSEKFMSILQLAFFLWLLCSEQHTHYCHPLGENVNDCSFLSRLFQTWKSGFGNRAYGWSRVVQSHWNTTGGCRGTSQASWGVPHDHRWEAEGTRSKFSLRNIFG